MARMSTVLLLTLITVYPSVSFAIGHDQKSVEQVFLPDSRPCTFFTLLGVANADPAVVAGPWFAVPKTHGGYKEIVTTLLLASTTGRKVYVGTSGIGVPECSGSNRVEYLILLP